MERKIVSIISVLALVLTFSFISNANAAKTQTLAVSATVSTVSNGLSLGLSRVVPGTGGAQDNWTVVPITNGLAFGSLTLDPTYKVFKAAYYYALDIGILDNSGSAWTITHTMVSVANGNNNLNDNINVTFDKQLTSTSAANLSKNTLATSNNKAFTKAQLAGGWLRIYYGIATGNTDPANGTIDNPGALPITLDKPAGTYSGSVTITMTP